MATDPSKNNDPTDNTPEGEHEDAEDAGKPAPKDAESAGSGESAKAAKTGEPEESAKPAKTGPSRSQTTADKEKEADRADASSRTTLHKDPVTGAGSAPLGGDGDADILSSDHDDLDADDDDGDGDGDNARPLTGAVPGGGFAAGAAAVVSGGLGLASLTGTSLGEMLRSRKELIGQIESSTSGQQGGGGGDQIDAFYSAPWHTAALLNGIFALAAVIIGGVLLGLLAQRAETRSWVKAVALAGVILGVLGLLVAAGMYFDLFASAPELPDTPQAPQPQQ